MGKKSVWKSRSGRIIIALAVLPWCAYIQALLWAVACVHRQHAAQDLPSSDRRMELLTGRIKAVEGKGLKTTPVPVVRTGKRTVDESERMSSWLRQINAAPDTISLPLPQPQMTP